MAGPAVLRISIISSAAGAVAGIRETDGALGKLGKGAAVAGAGIAAAGVAAIAFGKDAYEAASRTQQAFGALESVFGDSADTLQAWAKDAASTVGLATSEYAELASILGAQLTNMGRSQAEAAKQSDELIRLGADLAATFGGSVADAVSAVSSTLKGETDPIERYGISIKQADINAHLAAQGLDKLEGAAAKTATATAALELITKQSASAAGAFGRESNTAAGQQARFSANVENLKAKIGAGLLPVMTQAFGFLNAKAFPAAEKIGASLRTNLGPALSNVGRFITRDVVPAAREFITWFQEKIVPGIRGTVTPVINALRSAFASIADRIEGNSGSLEKLGRFLQKVAELGAKLAPILGKVLGVQLKIVGEIIGTVVDALGFLISAFDKAWQAAEKLGDIAGKITGPLDKVGGLVGKLNPFGGLPLVGAVGHLTGPVASTRGIRTITTAAGGLGGYGGGTFAGASAGLAGMTIDARTFFNVQVDGAFDPVATARQIEEILRAHAVRLARVPTFGPAA